MIVTEQKLILNPTDEVTSYLSCQKWRIQASPHLETAYFLASSHNAVSFYSNNYFMIRFAAHTSKINIRLVSNNWKKKTNKQMIKQPTKKKEKKKAVS